MHERQAQLAAAALGDPPGQRHRLLGEDRPVKRNQYRAEGGCLVCHGSRLGWACVCRARTAGAALARG